MFVVAMTFFSCNALACVSMNNQECKVRTKIIDINNNEPTFYPFSIKVNAVVIVIISIIHMQNYVFLMLLKTNVKVFNLMSGTNETRHIKWHKTCKCKCRLDASVCNNKQRWNKDKCRCECKELIDKGICEKDLFGILVIAIVNVINHVM